MKILKANVKLWMIAVWAIAFTVYTAVFVQQNFYAPQFDLTRRIIVSASVLVGAMFGVIGGKLISNYNRQSGKTKQKPSQNALCPLENLGDKK